MPEPDKLYVYGIYTVLNNNIGYEITMLQDSLTLLKELNKYADIEVEVEKMREIIGKLVNLRIVLRANRLYDIGS